MAKLTAELFGKLPDEVQQQILKEVPIDKLNDVEVLTPDDVDMDRVSVDMREFLMGLSNRKLIVMLVEMAHFMAQQTMEGAPPALKMAASLSIMRQVSDAADETMNRSKENDDD